jgi:phage gp16-like protein
MSMNQMDVATMKSFVTHQIKWMWQQGQVLLLINHHRMHCQWSLLQHVELLLQAISSPTS